MAAYGISRLRNRNSRGLLFGLLAMRMFPQILLAIPFFMLARFTGLIDTYPAMILAMIALNQPFTIWLMRSFFVDVPSELYADPPRLTAAASGRRFGGWHCRWCCPVSG